MENILTFADCTLIFIECTKNQEFSRKCPFLSHYSACLSNVIEKMYIIEKTLGFHLFPWQLIQKSAKIKTFSRNIDSFDSRINSYL